jgi:glycosyltransferase involved in cell wall biosynthesis
MGVVKPLVSKGGRRLNNLHPAKKPLVTIVTAVLNGQGTLERTIKSVIAQTCPDIEYIIVDGGSDDGTIDLLLKYDEHIDYWFSEPDKGIYDALNKGIALATGEWVYFIGADDALVNNEVIASVFTEKYQSRLVYGNVIHGNLDKKYGGEFTKKRLYFENICHQSIFYRRDIFELMGTFDTKYKLLADWAFNMRAFSMEDINPLYLDIVIADYSLAGVSATMIDQAFTDDKFRLIRKYFGWSHYLIARYLVLNELVHINGKKYIGGPIRSLFSKKPVDDVKQ